MHLSCQPKLNKTCSLSPRRLIPPDIGTTAEAHSGVLQQLPILSLKILNLLCTQTTQRMRGDFLIFLKRVVLVHTTCTGYIKGSAITVNIRLLSINIHHLQPFSSLTTWFSTYKNPNPWSSTRKTHFLTSKSIQTPLEMAQNWGRTLDV